MQHYENPSLPPGSVSSSHVRYQDQENTAGGQTYIHQEIVETVFHVFPPASVSSSHVYCTVSGLGKHYCRTSIIQLFKLPWVEMVLDKVKWDNYVK